MDRRRHAGSSSTRGYGQQYAGYEGYGGQGMGPSSRYDYYDGYEDGYGQQAQHMSRKRSRHEMLEYESG